MRRTFPGTSGAALVALVGATSAWARPPAVPPPRPIPVVMYHHVRDPEPTDPEVLRDLSCPPSRLVEHLEMLKAEGYTAVTFRHVLDDLAGYRALPEKPIVLTFDDGARDNTRAARALHAFGWRGVFFVTTATIGRETHLQRDHLVRLARAGFEIGSHSVSHPDLTTLSDRDLERQVQRSKQLLESWIGQPVVSFSYPGGRYDARVEAAVSQAGYLLARTTHAGVDDPFLRPYQIPMIRIHNATTARGLRWALESYGPKGPPRKAPEAAETAEVAETMEPVEPTAPPIPPPPAEPAEGLAAAPAFRLPSARALPPAG